MKECKVIALEGKTLEDYQNQLNNMLRGGWKLVGNFGKNNMLFCFSRDISVKQEEED